VDVHGKKDKGEEVERKAKRRLGSEDGRIPLAGRSSSPYPGEEHFPWKLFGFLVSGGVQPKESP
jgi:hypothetical protein